MLQVYDSGTIFAPSILDIRPEDLGEKLLAGVANLASVCLSIGYPTIASAPHSIANGFKNLLALAAVNEVEFKEATTIKEYIKVIYFLYRYLIILKSFFSYHYRFQKCICMFASIDITAGIASLKSKFGLEI